MPTVLCLEKTNRDFFRAGEWKEREYCVQHRAQHRGGARSDGGLGIIRIVAVMVTLLIWHNDIFYLSPAPPLSQAPTLGALLNPGPLPAPTPKASPSSPPPGNPSRLQPASHSQTQPIKVIALKVLQAHGSSSFASTKTFTALTPKDSDRVRMGSVPG